MPKIKLLDTVMLPIEPGSPRNVEHFAFSYEEDENGVRTGVRTDLDTILDVDQDVADRFVRIGVAELVTRGRGAKAHADGE